MNSNAKGAIAEQAIVLAAIRAGIPVWRPVAERERADLVFEVSSRLFRVQCKWGRLSCTGDVVIVKIGGSWCSPKGYVCTTYSEDEVDLFAIYCGELDRCFLVPAALAAGKHELWLRIFPARNGQRSCINLADNFDFEGAIAQLGERSAGSRKVAGSNPASSTSSSPSDGSSCEPLNVASNPFRDRLGYWMDRVAAGDEIVITRHGKPRIRLSPAAPQPGVASARRRLSPGSPQPGVASARRRLSPAATTQPTGAPSAAHSEHSPEMISSAPCG
jgi:prevent-host-death family protein